MDERMRLARAAVFWAINESDLSDAIDVITDPVSEWDQFLVDDGDGWMETDWEKVDAFKQEVDTLAHKLMAGILAEMSGWQL